MGSGDSSYVGDWHIPTVVASVAWFASALAVLGYTYIAFKETAGGSDSLDASPPGRGPVVDPSAGFNPKTGRAISGPVDPRKSNKLLNMLPEVRGPNKPTDRGYFIPSPEAPK
jgi:hypothetical protein